MSQVTIWHNPRCSKSRETLELLVSKGIEPSQVLYLDETPSIDEISNAISMLGGVDGFVRTKEARYAELGLKNKDLSDKEWAKVLHDNPKLIERPLVITNGKAVLGRPPSNIEQLF